jgi:hypothetical protein
MLLRVDEKDFVGSIQLCSVHNSIRDEKRSHGMLSKRIDWTSVTAKTIPNLSRLLMIHARAILLKNSSTVPYCTKAPARNGHGEGHACMLTGTLSWNFQCSWIRNVYLFRSAHSNYLYKLPFRS